MKTGRMEAFSDGVIAVIITIMVLELKAPREATVEAALAVVPGLMVYGLSFLVVAIMWVNHHSYVGAARRATPSLLWANNNLLFWMSLIPFVTGWLSEHPREPLAVSVYGAELAVTGLAFLLLQWAIAEQNRKDGGQWALFCRIRLKAMLTVTGYALAAAVPWRAMAVSYAVFALIAAAYFLPDRRLAGASEQAG